MLPGRWKDWEIVDDIGSGSYGTVYQIEKDDECKAVKIIEIPQKDEYNIIMKAHGKDAEAYCRSIAQDFEAEINTLMMLSDCENVVKIEDYVILQKDDGIGWSIYIFMDCLTSFTEYAALHEFHEPDIIRLGLEISNALVACHKQGIIHRDIKPENILVTDEGRFLLCDFGLARQLNYKQQISSVKGTYKYMAPEVYHGQNYTDSVDIYSLGLILYQYMNKRRGVFLPLDKKTIFFKDEEAVLEKRMNNAEIPPPVEASENFADIILRMIAYHPEDRYESADKLHKDLLLLSKGKYHKKHYFIRHYRRHILAGAFVVLMIAAYIGWRESPVWKDRECGENSVCTLNKAGTLTISGTGSVDDNEAWYEDKDKLKKIIVKKGITDIGEISDGLFSECRNLETLILPDGLKAIGSDAFGDCHKLKNVTLPDSVENLGSEAFARTPWIKDQADQNGFVIKNGTLMDYIYNKTSQDDSMESEGSLTDTTKQKETVRDLVIPDEVKTISDYVFEYNEEIRSLVIPDTTEYIGKYAFKDCVNLEKIQFGKKIKWIRVGAFQGTKWQEDVVWPVVNGLLLAYNGKEKAPSIPKEVVMIGEGAFQENAYIEEIEIPATVEKIDCWAFAYCTGLKKAVIPDGIKDIEPYTFYECSALNQVRFPSSLETIQPSAFSRCIHLKKVRIPKATTLVDEVDGDKVEAPFTGCKGIEIERY